MRKICAVKCEWISLNCPADKFVSSRISADSMKIATHNVFDRQLWHGVVDLDESLG
jgi:hypothetical protein